MKIELVGGPHCGLIRDTRSAEFAPGMWHEGYEPIPGKPWNVKYTRTGLRTKQGFQRYDYVGQVPLVSKNVE